MLVAQPHSDGGLQHVQRGHQKPQEEKPAASFPARDQLLLRGFFEKTTWERDYEKARTEWKAIKHSPDVSRATKEKVLYQKLRLKEKATHSKKWKEWLSGPSFLGPHLGGHAMTGALKIIDPFRLTVKALALPLTLFPISHFGVPGLIPKEPHSRLKLGLFRFFKTKPT